MDYFWGKWANTNCSDPKELYEAIIFKPEDIIDAIEFTYWTKSNVTFYSSIHEFNRPYVKKSQNDGIAILDFRLIT